MTASTCPADLNREAYGVLFRELGPSRALRFLQQFAGERKNYQVLKDAVFGDLSVDKIAAEIVAARNV